MSKVVLIGDAACGKTSFAVAASGECASLDAHGPIYSTEIKIKNKMQSIDFIDTSGQDENQRQRVSNYMGADLFILVFSIISPFSFDNIKSKWFPEIFRYNPNVPVLLIGTKVDLRSDEEALERLFKRKLAPISYQQGISMSREIGAMGYVECNCLDEVSLTTVIDKISDIMFPKEKETKSKSKPKIKRSVSAQQKKVVITRRKSDRANCTVM
eukprot:TRINITY_DN839_c0_g1_i2.p1 TRINITY_DN839_c0_g1~~TRINITY_DN839_c0_g1_i2.p1  ORF type:complete len:213 (-),score=21.42 TRINITY_DN839_c0_g1_i2:120-758(-)